MRKFICILAMALLLPMFASAQEKYLETFPQGENVQKFFLNKDMISLAMSQMDSDPTMALYKQVFKDLTSMEVLQSTNVNMIEDISASLMQLIEDKKASSISDAEEGDNRSMVYTIDSKSNDNDDSMIICQKTPKEVFIMVLHGDIDLARLAAIGM